MTELAVSARVDALDVFVQLLSELDDDGGSSSREFYDRVCEAVCRLTSMRRAGLLLYDDTRKLVVPVGSHGVPPEIMEQIYGNLEETPIAQRALGEDRVVEVSEGLERELPERYARFAGVTTLTCTPVSAGGRWLGVIFADRGGGRFALTDQERHALWTLGKTAALAASARIATTQHERARGPQRPDRPGSRGPRAGDAAAVRRIARRRLPARAQRGASGGAAPRRSRLRSPTSATTLSRPLAPSLPGRRRHDSARRARAPRAAITSSSPSR